MRHIPWFARYEELTEGIAYACNGTDFSKMPGEMRTTDHRRVANVAQCPFETVSNTGVLERPGDRPSATRPTRSHTRKACHETHVLGIDPEADDMHRCAAPSDRNLDTRDEADARFTRGLGCFGKTGHLVMIGERQQADTLRGSTPNQRGRSKHPVRSVRMTV